MTTPGRVTTVPKTVEAATVLLEQRAALAAQIADLEVLRQAEIARVNATSDAGVAPLLAEMAALDALAEKWWAKAAAALTGGKRKSIELGGCRLGTRTVRETAEFMHGDDRVALAAIEAAKLNGVATAVKRVLDRSAILALLKRNGATGKKLVDVGFRVAGGGEAFFVTRADSAAAKISAQG